MTNEEKMTPEEAIAEISFLKVAVNKVMEQALEMAIQALSQEPCDDVISREAVLNLCTNDRYKIPYEYEDDKGIHRGYDEYRLINYYKLKQLPPVTQKSGKWIRSLIYENTFNCSKCGSAGYDTFKYCPNCGVKMESGDKG